MADMLSGFDLSDAAAARDALLDLRDRELLANKHALVDWREYDEERVVKLLLQAAPILTTDAEAVANVVRQADPGAGAAAKVSATEMGLL